MNTQRPVPDPEMQPWLSIPAAGVILGLGRAASYQAARRGEIPTVRVGGRFLVPTARLRALLGLAGRPVTPLSHPASCTGEHVETKEAS